MENLVTVTIRSTHHYLIDTGQGMLMIDPGWAGSLPELVNQLQRYKIDLPQIRFVMFTHHHPDHAGLTQEIKKASKARLIILEHQIPFLENLTAFYAAKGGYEPVRIEAGDMILTPSNRADLEKIGLLGAIVATPGHSDDSVSLVLDSGKAFTGDLHLPDMVQDEARAVTCQSWKTLLRLNTKMVFPGHGIPFPIEDIQQSLVVCE